MVYWTYKLLTQPTHWPGDSHSQSNSLPHYYKVVNVGYYVVTVKNHIQLFINHDNRQQWHS